MLEVFGTELESRVGALPQSALLDAAFAHDAASLLLTTWFRLRSGDGPYSQRFVEALKSSRFDGVTVSLFCCFCKKCKFERSSNGN